MGFSWQKVPLQLEDSGEWVEAQAPEIISASRSTDIPAFYADWFFDRLKKGNSAWINPFNGKKSYVSYQNTRFIVFWSKNPYPLLSHLDQLKEMGIGCYIQYSLNDYENERLEKNVPNLDFRINTFKLLSEKLGSESVIWRFDPLLLTDDIDINSLLHKIERIGSQLFGYTEKLVFSFADIAIYSKVKQNLIKNGIEAREWTESQMREFAQRLSELNNSKGWNYELATCGEKIDFGEFNINANHCIDYSLIARIAHDDKPLLNYISATIKTREADLFGNYEPLPADAIELPNGRYIIRDKGQRDYCGCMKSKDIGQYNTCIHQCEYCYANTSKQMAMLNYNEYLKNPYKDTIIGL